MNDELTALASVDRAGRIGRTTVQVGIPGSLVILLEWGCALQGWDLDPWGEGTGLPSTVSAAMIAILTVVLAFRMNRKPPAEPNPAGDVVDTAVAVAQAADPPKPRIRRRADEPKE